MHFIAEEIKMLRSQGAREPKICLQTFSSEVILFLSTQYFLPFHAQSLKTLTERKHPGKEWRSQDQQLFIKKNKHPLMKT